MLLFINTLSPFYISLQNETRLTPSLFCKLKHPSWRNQSKTIFIWYLTNMLAFLFYIWFIVTLRFIMAYYPQILYHFRQLDYSIVNGCFSPIYFIITLSAQAVPQENISYPILTLTLPLLDYVVMFLDYLTFRFTLYWHSNVFLLWLTIHK